MTSAVVFEQVTKEFRSRSATYQSLRADLAGLARRLGPWTPPAKPSHAPVLALDAVSFEIAEGSSTAIVGRNGAGKSTALRLISRITYPTGGRVRVRGRVGALIEIGAGVHPELTGRENIWLYGSFLGFSRAGIRRRFDEIVEFAEIGSAVDRQVKHYSTGMALRLGFAIASYLEPAVFIVDESLAVGDGAFQAKCMQRMRQLGRDGATIVFVSHELASVEALCEEAIWLDQGRLREHGPIDEVLRAYNRSLDEASPLSVDAGSADAVLRCTGATLRDPGARVTSTFRIGAPLRIDLELEAHEPIAGVQVCLRVTDGQWEDLIEVVSPVDHSRRQGRWTVSCSIDSLPLNPRLYQLWCSVNGRLAACAEHDRLDGYAAAPSTRLLDWCEVASLRVQPDRAGAASAFAGPPVAVRSRWCPDLPSETGELPGA